MISINGHKLNATRFPDKTSQVWKQPDGLLSAIEKDSVLNIHWEFEDEYELLHIFQLLEFVSRMKIKGPADQMVVWDIPYMPYARQDKDVSNTSCWALHFIAGMFSGVPCELHTFDVHNPSFFEQYPENKYGVFESQITKEGVPFIVDGDSDIVNLCGRVKNSTPVGTKIEVYTELGKYVRFFYGEETIRLYRIVKDAK